MQAEREDIETVGSRPVPESSSAAEPPRLRIHHLMACAAVAAVQLSIMRASAPTYGATQPGIAMIPAVVRAVLLSIGLTLALFLVYWRIKRLVVLNQPGQWLLLSFILYSIQNVLYALWWYSMGFDPSQGSIFRPGDRNELWAILDVVNFIVVYVASLVFFVWCAVKRADSWLWRLVFLALAISPILASGFVMFAFGRILGMDPRDSYVVIFGVRSAGLILLELSAVASDHLAHRARNWMHWAGLGIVIMMQLLSMLLAVIHWLQI